MTEPLPPDVWRRVEELFAEAVGLPPGERRDYLERHATDPRVRREVESLLDFAGDRPAESLRDIVEEEALRLDAGDGEVGAPADGDVGAPAGGESLIGSRIGPYRVVREIGRGGMGVVYLGQREESDFDQRVALKLLPGALFDRSMTRRFRNERRILAALEHPNVARFLDGGTTRGGVPWVAMEYVDGEPIDRYCDRAGLDLDARLALFEKVCDAVRYAHGKLIVHRDLKPDNVLVGEDGEPKLLDFGIARLVDPDEEAGRTATLIMTPRYASPEQIAGRMVTTSADIYSLGALLYLLISGRKPHGEVTSRSELFRVVSREDPAPPSEVAGRPGLAGDLDTIVLTAMRREPEERYASVDRLQQDIEAFRTSRPIAARPQTLRYRAGKFIARNRATVIAGATAVLALLVGGGAATVGLMRARAAEGSAREEALVAEEVTEFLVDLFQDPAPRVSGGADRTARQILDRGVERIGVELEGQPALQARLRYTMGTSFAGLGDYHKADSLYSLALETTAAEDAGARALILAAQGDARRNLGQLDDALEALDSATAVSAARVDTTDSASLARTPDLSRALVHALRETGVVLAMRGAFEPAIDTLTRAHRLTLRAFGAGSEREARSAGTLAYGHIMAGDLDAAIPLYERRSEILAGQGERSAGYLIATDNLAAAYAMNGELERAEKIYLRLLPLEEEVFGTTHPMTGQTLHNLGSLYRDAGRLDEAERYLRRGLAVNTELYGPDAVGITEGLNNLALVHQARGEWAETERLFQRAAEIRREALGPDSPRYASVLLGVGNARRNQQKWAAAAEAYREGVDILRARGPVAPVVLSDYAQVLRQLGRVEEAEAVEREVAAARAAAAEDEEEGA